MRYEQANENVRFRPRWIAAGKVCRRLWSAVLIIPLDVLRVPRGGKQTWRLQFVRQIAATGRALSWVWNPIMGDSGSGTWPTFQNDTRFWAGGDFDIAASAAARPKPRADIYGLASIGEDRNLFQQANGKFLPENVRSFGGDVSYPITPTIRFRRHAQSGFLERRDRSANDRAARVPTATPRVPAVLRARRELHQCRFRPALAGRHLSTAPDLVFYSPSVGPFDSGGKVEGTFGDQSFGALTFHGYDETTGNTFADQAYGYEHALPNGSFLYWSDGVFANHSIAGNDNTIEAGAEARDYSKRHHLLLRPLV